MKHWVWIGPLKMVLVGFVNQDYVRHHIGWCRVGLGKGLGPSTTLNLKIIITLCFLTFFTQLHSLADSEFNPFISVFEGGRKQPKCQTISPKFSLFTQQEKEEAMWVSIKSIIKFISVCKTMEIFNPKPFIHFRPSPPFHHQIRPPSPILQALLWEARGSS